MKIFFLSCMPLAKGYLHITKFRLKQMREEYQINISVYFIQICVQLFSVYSISGVICYIVDFIKINE